MKIAIIILASALALFILLFIQAECAFRETVKKAAQDRVRYNFVINGLKRDIEQLRRRITTLEVIAHEVESEAVRK